MPQVLSPQDTTLDQKWRKLLWWAMESKNEANSQNETDVLESWNNLNYWPKVPKVFASRLDVCMEDCDSEKLQVGNVTWK